MSGSSCAGPADDVAADSAMADGQLSWRARVRPAHDLGMTKTMTFEPGSTYERIRLECAEIRLTEDGSAITVNLLLWSYDASGKLHAYWVEKALSGDALAAYLLSVIQVAGVTSWAAVKDASVVAVRGPGSRSIIGLAPVPDGQTMPNTAFRFDAFGE